MPSIAIAATATAAASALYGGISSAESAHYQSQVAKNNATAARQNAVYSAQATASQTEQSGLKAAQKVAGVTAAQAANGLDVNTGSAADVSSSERELALLDTSTVAERGALQTYGYETQAKSFQDQSKAYQAQVGPDIFGGILKAGASVAGHADQLGIGGSGGDASSLISSAPDVPSTYSWMSDGNQLDRLSQDWDQ